MKYYKIYSEVKLNEIKPCGWIKTYLKNQKDGLTGQMENAGHPFNGPGWTGFAEKEYYENWAAYEQTGYWIDGAIKCGYLLDDNNLITKAKRNIDYVMSNPDINGYLGPASLKDPILMGLWPHVVFFRSVIAYYRATGDRSVIDKMVKHYKAREINIKSLREVCNLEILLFLYEETGDEEMLNIATKKYAEFERLYYKDSLVKEVDICYYDVTEKNLFSNKKSKMHGVSYNEVGKIPAILYMYTGDVRLLKISKEFFKKIDKHHMLVNGVCSSSEMLNTTTSLDTCETCDTADFTWSLGYLLMATGDPKYADKIEKAIFNAAPGAVTDDFKALQYFSGTNQVICDYQSNHNKFFRGNSSMSFRPNPFTECCPGEVNRIMPNFTSRMWMKKDNGIAAALYGPSEFSTVINGTNVSIKEITNYPFAEEIIFEFKLSNNLKFSFDVRIPGWCNSPEVIINGTILKDAKIEKATFYSIERNFSDGDRITLKFPMGISISKWPKGGIAVERGPLVYSLGIVPDKQIDTKYHKDKSSEEFPAWNMYAVSDWNYALVIDESNFTDVVKVIENAGNYEKPWSLNNAPIKIEIPAKKIDNWKLEAKKVSGYKPYIFDNEISKANYKRKYLITPELPKKEEIEASQSNPIERLTLVPYGCTDLRITIFPKSNTLK